MGILGVCKVLKVCRGTSGLCGGMQGNGKRKGELLHYLARGVDYQEGLPHALQEASW